MTDDVKLDRSDEDPRGRRILDGTDLEISYNLRGDNLVLRVNKGGVQIFRVMLEDACAPLDGGALVSFNSVSPDFVFKIGDTKARMLQLAKSVGLDDAQLARLEAKLSSLSS